MEVPFLKKRDRVLAIIQARTTSTRFPNKIYKELNGCPVLYHVIARAKQCRLVDKVIVASPVMLNDLPDNTDSFVFEGDENDVLSRYYWCAKENKAGYYVRLTSDCPLLAPSLIDTVVYNALVSSADYCSNVMKLTFPDGVDTEVISKKCLDFLFGSVQTPYHREHVTTIIRDNKDLQEELDCVSIENSKNLSYTKYSVDTPQDLDTLKKLENLGSYI